jgi:hypothetical protein
MFEKTFLQDDVIRYSLKGFEGEVKKLHHDKDKNLEHIEVYVNKSENPKVIEGSRHFIWRKNFQYVEIIPNDNVNLNYTHYDDIKKLDDILQEKLISNFREYQINKALDSKDQALFNKLVGADEK